MDDKTPQQEEPYGPAQEEGASPKVRKREPMFSIPPVTGVLLLINLAVFFARFVMPESVYENWLVVFSFIPARFADIGLSNIFVALSPLTYMFLHGNGLHITMNAAMLLGIGSGVEQALGKVRYLLLYLLCGVFAVLCHFVLYPDGLIPLVGASGAVSGLFGAVLLMMQKMGRFKPGIKGILPIVVIWSAMNIVLGLIGIPGEPHISVAWVAHLGGFYAGLALFPLFLKRI